MIEDRDLPGPAPRTATALITVATAAVVAAGFVLVVVAVPHAPSRPRSEPFVAAPVRALPSFVPAPRTPRLSLPRDLAVDVTRSSNLGNTAELSDPGTVRVYRLRAGGDVVFLENLGRESAVGRPADVPGLTGLSLSERGAVFRLASRTLDPVSLARLADHLIRSPR